MRLRNLLKKIAQKYCEDLQIEPFEIEFSEDVSATLEITEPEVCSFEITGVRMAGITDSLEAEFFYGPTIHSKKDVVDYLSIPSFNQSVAFIIAFATRIIEAKVIPIPSTMPKDRREELDEYLAR